MKNVYVWLLSLMNYSLRFSWQHVYGKNLSLQRRQTGPDVINQWLSQQDMVRILHNNGTFHVYRTSTDNLYVAHNGAINGSVFILLVAIYIWVQVFSLILDSSVGLSASIQSAGDLVSGTPGSNPAFSRGTQLFSFRFEYRLPVPEHRNLQQQICISPEPGAKVNWQWGQVGSMLHDHRDGLSSSSF